VYGIFCEAQIQSAYLLYLSEFASFIHISRAIVRERFHEKLTIHLPAMSISFHHLKNISTSSPKYIWHSYSSPLCQMVKYPLLGLTLQQKSWREYWVLYPWRNGGDYWLSELWIQGWGSSCSGSHGCGHWL